MAKRGSIVWADLQEGGPTQLQVLGPHPVQIGIVGCIAPSAIAGGRPVSFRRDGETIGGRAIWLAIANLRQEAQPTGIMKLGSLENAALDSSMEKVFGNLQEDPMETASSGAEREETGLTHRVAQMERSGRELRDTLVSQSEKMDQVLKGLVGLNLAGSSTSIGAGGREKREVQLPLGSSSSSPLLAGLRKKQGLFGLEETAPPKPRNVLFDPEIGGDSTSNEEGDESEDEFPGMKAFAKNEGKKQKGKEEVDLIQMMAAANPQGMDMASLVQLEMLKQLRALQTKKVTEESSDSETEAGLLKSQSSSKLKGIVRLRRRIRKHPKRCVHRFALHVRNRLGVRSARQAWTFMDYSLKLVPRFGKMKGLWRCHWILAQVVQAHIEGRTDYGIAFAVQGMKCLHQVALNSGGWQIGHLLLPEEDPLSPEEFGGDPEELMAAQSYKTALDDLKKMKSKADEAE